MALDLSSEPVYAPPLRPFVGDPPGTVSTGGTYVPESDPFPPLRSAPDPSNRVLKVRFVKRPADNRIVKCEVFDADTREVVGQIYVSDVTLSYPAKGSHPEALVRLISAWEDAYE